MRKVSIVPPLIEISVPFSIESFECGVLVRVHLFEGFVEEVVQLVTAVVVAASVTWAIKNTGLCFSVECVAYFAASSWAGDIATSRHSNSINSWVVGNIVEISFICSGTAIVCHWVEI